MSSRRHDDELTGPFSRREDVLEALLVNLREQRDALEDLRDAEAELRRHGSENFRAYRRRALAAFAILFAGAVSGLGYVVYDLRTARDLGRQARYELAASGALVSVRGCFADDETRTGIRAFLERQDRDRYAEAARVYFPPRPCVDDALPLLADLPAELRVAELKRLEVLEREHRDRARELGDRARELGRRAAP